VGADRAAALSAGPALLVLVAFSLYVFRLDSPAIPIFDEGLFYIPAAKAYLAGLPDPNFEHPPLSKLSIAAGVAMLGDGPWGWRFPSAFAGTLGVVLTYRLGRRLWASPSAGLFAAALLAVDFLWFEVSRLALLDVFQGALLLLSLNFAVSGKTVAGGLSLGLAAAAKWSALWAGAGVAWALMASHPQTNLKGPNGDGPSVPWRQHALLVGLLILFAVGGYCVPWLYNVVVLGEGLPELLNRHLRMLSYGAQVGAEGASTLEILLTPGWWLLNGPLVVTAREDPSVWMVVMSNPFVFWGGLVAAAVLLRNPPARWLVVAVLALYLPWFLVPRLKYFYYLTPALPLLAVAVPGGWLLNVPRVWRAVYLTAAIAAFVGAYPMLTGAWIR